MKKIIPVLIILSLFSCKSTKNVSGSNLYEVLVTSEYGGNNFKFYEIITEPNEFKMLLKDDEISQLVKSKDIENSNFVLINIGEKSTGGYGIVVESVVEEADKIVIKIKETEPKPGTMVTTAITSPYAVLKINSKKPIEIY